MEKFIGVIIEIALVLGGMGLIKPAVIYFARSAIEAQAHSISYGAWSRSLNGTISAARGSTNQSLKQQQR